MPIPVEEEFLDVLQNLESAIVAYFRAHPDLADPNVDRVLDALLRAYKAEARGERAPVVRLSELEQGLAASIKMMADWRLGRGESPIPLAADAELAALTSDDLLACLKRMRKSLDFWTKKSGRQGYLNYIQQFL